MNPSAKSWLDAALGFFYPNVCQLCGAERATAGEGYVCASCWSQPGGIHFIQPPFCERCGLPYEGDITTKFECSNCREMELHFTSARAAVAAQGLVLEVIHRYKYQQALWFEPFLADLFARQAVPQIQSADWDLIVPIPLHPLKLREREFNQAERLADCLGRATQISVKKQLVQRVESTRTQTRLTRDERAENMRGAFLAKTSDELAGKRVIIVDDVLTTGATASACAKALRKAGAANVAVWTLARGL